MLMVGGRVAELALKLVASKDFLQVVRLVFYSVLILAGSMVYWKDAHWVVSKVVTKVFDRVVLSVDLKAVQLVSMWAVYLVAQMVGKMVARLVGKKETKLVAWMVLHMVAKKVEMKADKSVNEDGNSVEK